MNQDGSSWNHGIRLAALSDVGLRRSNNQDAWSTDLASSLTEWRRRGHLLVVADGMGAHAAGELASKMAIDTIPLNYRKSPEESCVVALQRAVEEANARIHARGQENPDFRGMGTTSSVLLLLPEGAVVAQVGDSRVYRLRGQRLEQLSFDHSLVWEMKASGKLGDGDVPNYIPKNIITRSLGPSEQVQVDLEGPFPLELGDTFLLCSDGLSGQVEDAELGALLSVLSPEEAARALVDLANLRGGPDNITVIIAQVTGAELTGAAMDYDPADGGIPSRGNRVHPFSWVVLGVLALLTLLMVATGNGVIAATTGLALAATAGFVLVQLFGGSLGDSALRDRSRLGAGPHVSIPSTPDQGVVDKLARVVMQLRDAARDEQWQIDWTKFEDLVARATKAAAGNDFATAVREHAHAVIFMMSELRNQRRRRADG